MTDDGLTVVVDTGVGNDRNRPRMPPMDHLSTDFLTYLGFTINPKLTPLVEVEGEQVTVSAERLDVLDSDAIVFACDEPNSVPKLKQVPTFDKLPAVAEGRSVYTDPTLAGAIYFTSPLSLPYVLEHLTPQLTEAVAGKAPQRVVSASK